MTILALGALLALLAAAGAALARLGRHSENNRDQQHIEQHQKALDAMPRVIPPTGVNPTNGRVQRPFDWAREEP